jgi:pimeloyl-ACP methyl ester carboxylesterase
MSGRSVFRGIFWGLIAVLLFVHVVGGWFYSNRIIDEAFTPDPSPRVVPEGSFELQQVTYETDLGDMDAWYLPASGTTWVIHIHGLNATPAQPEVLFSPLQEAGYPQLSLTYRNDEGEPADPSGYFRYGATEWEDVLGAVEYAKANGAEDIVFMGYATGASHALSFAYRHNYDEIAGVIIDSGNIDVGATVDHRASQDRLPVISVGVPRTMTWVAKFFTSLRIDVNWRSIDYIDAAKRSLRVPVLAIHGADDESIPIDQSIELADTQPELVELYTVEGAGHVDSFNTDFDGYVSRVLAFLDEIT